MADNSISLREALWRGFRMRCPNCGQGHLFSKYLKVAHACPCCHEEYFHHRADDLPAYLVIVLVGHLVVPALVIVEEIYAPALWLQYLIWLPLMVVAAVALLQPTKGAVVALQWKLGMHGFAQQAKPIAAKLPLATADGPPHAYG
jgi:uncharacterized protein (DUF983 family)